MAGYTRVQRKDKGFDFFDNRGKKINVDQYVQGTGSSKSQLINDMAAAGDRVSQTFARMPQQTRDRLWAQDARNQKDKADIYNPLRILGDIGKAAGDLGKGIVGVTQQGAGALGDIATQGGALVGRIGVQTNPFTSPQQKSEQIQQYDRELINPQGVTNQLRGFIQAQKDINGNRIVGTSDVDQNAARIASGQGNLQDYAAVLGKSLDAATTATMLASPTAIARGAGNLTGRQLLNYAGKDALMYGGVDAAAGFGNTYGQTGDLGLALKQGATQGAVSGLTQGALDGIAAGIRKAPQAVTQAPQSARAVATAVNNTRPSVIARQDPRVTGFDDQYATLAQQFDSLPAGSPQRQAVSQAMAQNRAERLGALRGVQREIGQGGYARIPGESSKSPRQQTPGAQPLRLSDQEGQLKTSPSTTRDIQSSPRNSRLLPGGGDLLNQSSKSQTTPTINTNRYNISDDGKQALTDTVEGLSKEITQRTGRKLSLDEVAQAADETTNILRTGKTREATLKATAEMQNARQKQAVLAEKMARGETLTPIEQADMVRLTVSINTTKTDLARQLGSLRNTASARDRNIIDVVLEKLSKEIGDADAVANAAKNYDLSDMRQLGEFYRTFVKATPEDWLDKLRYNSMLSSPVTHSRNIFANVTGSTIVAPLQKTFEGMTDAARALITGTGRTRYAGEAGHYAGEYLKGMFSKQAREQFKKAMKGELGDVNVDMNELYSLPLAQKGFAGAMDKILGFTTRLTDAVDQWALSAVRRGEEAGLNYRAQKGSFAGDVSSEALKKAEYRLFRGKLGNKEEGWLLRAIDFIPQKVLEATASKNPVVRIPAKLTFPFVKTPTNVAKQMIEFSPLGLANIPGAADKTAAVAKAVMGTTAIATVTGTLAANDALTFALPANPTEREKFLAEGKQPYSFKVGDKWLSYQYLHPALSFNMAAVASVNEAVRKGDMDEDTASKVLEGMAGASRFFVDQSYFKNAQDFLANMTADSFSSPATMAAQYAKNVATQFVPFRALMTWTKNMVDPVQRKVDTSQGVFDQFIDSFKKDLPGLSQDVDAYTDALGEPVKNTDVLINAISPIRVKTETPSAAQGTTDLAQEVNRLYKVDEGIKLGKLAPKVDFSGVETKLPSEQRKQLEDNINSNTKKLWNSIVTSSEYQAMNDEDKRKVLSSAKSDVTAAMKDRFAQDYLYGQYASDYSGEQKKLTKKQQAIANGTLSAQAYLSEEKKIADTKTAKTKTKKVAKKKPGGRRGRRSKGFTEADIELIAKLNSMKSKTASNLLDLLGETSIKRKTATPQTQKVALKQITVKG